MEALIGVLIGGLLTGGFAAWGREVQRYAELRTAVRLLDLEFATLKTLVTAVAQGYTVDEQAREQFVRRPKAWDDHQAILARNLSASDWNTLAIAIFGIEIAVRTPQDDAPAWREACQDLDGTLTAAHLALEKYHRRRPIARLDPRGLVKR